MVWLAFALMTAAAVLCVVWPLLRPRPEGPTERTDVAFYLKQLKEIDADAARGLLHQADREAARAEVGRRLIRAADGSGGVEGSRGRRQGAVAVAAALFVVLGASGLYAAVGRPDQPDDPLALRQTAPGDLDTVIARAESHLADHPDDGRGYDLLAPLYMNLERYDDAVRAYREAIRLLGAVPARQAAFGQALVMAADGVVTAEARQVFDAALKDDPTMPQARFFEGLAAKQDGDKVKARTIWTALVAEAPPGAPYTDIIRGRLAELDGLPPPRPAAPPGVQAPVPAGAAAPGMPEGAAAVAALPPEQRNVAIRGMVDGLAARLAQSGQDPDGWLRLVRAYSVLGETELARKALGDARRAMTGQAQVLARLDSLARELGLEG